MEKGPRLKVSSNILVNPAIFVTVTANPDRDAYKQLWKFLQNLLSNYELTIHIHWRIIKLTGKHKKDFNMCFFNLSQGVDRLG